MSGRHPHSPAWTPRRSLALLVALAGVLAGCQGTVPPLAAVPAAGPVAGPAADPTPADPSPAAPGPTIGWVPASSVMARPVTATPSASASSPATPDATAQAARSSAPAAPASSAPAKATPKPAPATTTATKPAGGASADRVAWASAGYSLYRGPNKTQRVVLSYDDCPTSLAAFKRMVVETEAQGVALALFPLGTCLRAGTFDAAFARAHGHYVFNHSINHPQLSKVSLETAIRELGAPGVQTSWGRPPYGDIGGETRAAYRARGMRIWLWTVDTNDWRGHKPADEIVSIAVGESKAGGTVLMHMQENGFTPEVVARIKAGLAERGLGVCRNTGATAVSPLTINC